MGPNNAYIQTPKPVTGSFTIEFWFKPAGSSSAGCASWRCGEGLVDAATANASDNDFGISIFNNFVAFGMGTGSNDVSILSTTNVSTRIWRHIAASWDSTSGAMRLYVNGNLEASAIGGTGSRNGQALMRLGSLLQAPGSGFFGYFSGSLDEVRVWSKVRTQADIQANYTTNLNGREDGLAAYYNFNQGIANNQSNGAQTTLNDITPNGNNGSLNSFPALNNTGISGTWWGTFDLGFDPAKYPVVVTRIPLPSVTSTTGSTICGSGTTTLTATASAGAKIDWYDSASGGSALATGIGTYTTPTLSATTTYYAEARDTVTGCVSTSRTAVTATVGAIPTAGITNNTGSTLLTCTRTSISVTATGGSTYSWSNSLGSSANASITAPGTYTVTVTSAVGCQATSSITVTRDVTTPTAGITNNTGSTVVTCTTTSISVTATGGSTYSWSNSLGSSANASITAAGTYTVTVTGSNGCTATSSITTTQNNTAPAAGITNNTGATILTCTRTSINVTATGVGSSYSWNNSLGSSASASITSPGTYTVTVTGANACTTTSSITVTQNITAPTAGITNNTGSTILNCTTPAISVTATGGASYSWSNSLGSSANASITAPGTYTVTATGANGCTSTASITVTQNFTVPSAGITNNTGSTVLTCSTTAISVTATGVGSYSWSNSLGSSAAASITSPGTFTVTVTGTNGCTSTASITATQSNTIPSAPVVTNGSRCGDGTVTLSATSGTGTVVDWYASALTSSPLLTASTTYTTTSLSSSTNYYLISRDTVTGCTSAKPRVTNALNFDGIDDNVNAGNGTSLQFNRGTIEAWIKTGNAGSQFRAIVCKQYAFGLFLENNVLVAYNWNNLSRISTGINLADNSWHHVALSFDARPNVNTAKIYIDSILRAEAYFAISNQNDSMYIGKNSVSQQFSGTIDEVRVWNVARTQSEIGASMNSDLSGTESGLVAYYNFNQGVAGGTNTNITSLTDLTSNSNNASINNFTLTGNTSNFVNGPALSPVTVVTANVQPLPTVTSSLNGSIICTSGTTNLTATASAGAKIDWYADASGGTALATGIDTYTTPTLSATTTYYTEARDTVTNCVSLSRTAVTATVNNTTTAGITNNTGSTELTCIRTAISVTATGGSTYLWSNSLGTSANASITSPGTYTVTVTESNGCTATASITITQNLATSTGDTTVNVCNSFTWYGTTYTSSATPTHIFTNASGCDSTVTLLLTINTPPALPTLACYETASLNSATCSWEVTGTQPVMPTLACYETSSFNTSTCVWDVTGTQPSMPTLACYESANFNTSTCSWDVTGTQPSMPTLACYETATFNTSTCVWDVTGSKPSLPTLACYETASFNTSTCVWDVTGTQPSQPTLACYESANFNTTTCSWDVTGTIPTTPTLACYESANFNTSTCVWDVTGTQPSQPTLACYESANFNTTTCVWDVTGSQPSMPTLACYETASFNTSTCVWDVTGTQPSQPTLACYESANFNTSTCVWDVTGTQPSQPTLACYESANFNTTTCVWDVTGSQPSMPTLACYEIANFNTTTCVWDVTGSQPSQPTLACYETANFNTNTCAWDVTGSQPTMPTLACYETASFNTTSCSWDVTGTQPAQPSLACYETANFNTSTCVWDVTGSQPSQPTLACYESATFNTTTCVWDVTGSQPSQPTLACYESASFNSSTCVWDVTGSQPSQPTLACYESTNFNATTCSWDVTGTQPSQPSLACYESANFNTSTCVWDVTGIQPAAPTGLACYETAIFNTTSCAWDIIGSQPSMPTLACYETANFNTSTCVWDVTGTQPSMPTLACYETASFNTTICVWDVTGTQPAQPTLACYESANFNTSTCVWDVTGMQPAQPSLACYESANFNTTSCAWDVTGTQPSAPTTLACYETASFNTGSCSWVVTGSQPAMPTLACYETASFNTTTCAWVVTGTPPAQPTAVDGSRFGTGTVSLSATVSAGNTVDWYAAATGGTALSTGSTAFTTPSISSTTSYYAESRNITTGCVSASRTAVTATVNALLVVGVSISSNATNNSICRGTAVTFTATPTNGGNTPTYQWRRNGVNIFTGSQITLNNIQVNDQISVVMTTSLSAASVTNTTATSNTITLTVNNLPSVVSTTPASITTCTSAGSATINAVPTTGSVIDWYASTSSTTPLLTSSNSFTTPTISSTTTYYPVARDTATGCQSNGLTSENMAINMGPNNAYIQTAKPVTGSFTIEFWFKPAGTSSAGCASWRCGEGLVDANTSDPNDRDFGITIYNSYVAFGMGNGSGNPDVSILSTTNVSTRVWRHIAASWDSTSGAMRLYVNGNLEASATGGTGSRNGQALMRLGSMLQAPGNGFYGYFSGSLDEVRVWSKVRTQADIQANYTTNLNGREDGLAQYYNFNQGMANNAYNGTQTTLYDITPNGNNGSLNQFIALGNTGIQGTWWGTFDLGFDPAKYPVVVTKITTPTVTSTTGSTICGSGTTTLTATASAGAKIDWYANATGGTALATGTNTFITPTVSATTVYYAEARDSVAGCVSLSRTAVTASIGVVPTAGITNNTGSTVLTCTTTAISVTATGGSTYLWSNSLGSSANASITAAGTYTVTVTGANGCSSTASITVTIGDVTSPTAGITNNTGITVLTCTTSAISVTATGGSSYLWSNSLGTSANASIATAGTYTVTVTGANGCTATSSITITRDVTTPTTAITNNTGSTILNCNTTAISVMATGGDSYSWSNSLGTSSTASITAAGTYTVTATGANGCTASANITIMQDTSELAISINNIPLTTILNCNTQSITLNAAPSIFENFNNGQWDTTNFILGAPVIGSGSVVNGGYADPTNSRSPLRTVAQFHPDTNHVLTVSATIKFTPGQQRIGFIATRSSGTILNANDEPYGAKMRIHNFNDGQTTLPNAIHAQLTNSFYNNPVRVTMIDNGLSVICRLVNLVTLVEHNFTVNTTGSNGDYIMFSGGSNNYWDDIEISYGNPNLTYTWADGNGTSLGTSSATSINTPGTYTVTATAANGCTSTASVAITQNIATSTGDTTAFACNSFTWYGTTYTSSGTPTHTLDNVNGCDSVVTLHLTINTPPALPTLACYETASLNTTTCSWVVTGTQPSVPSGLACYETAIFNTTTCSWDVTGSLPDTIVTTITNCGDFTWSTNGQVYTQSGTYISYVNCQDYKLNLTVLPTTIYYADTDGDGYGNPSATILACNGAPNGYVAQSGDCNDTSATAYPGSTEICGNGIDDDCDGQIDEGGSLVTNPIIGNLQICGLYAGATTLTTAPISGISTYNWTVPSDITITSGQGTNTITVYWDYIYLLSSGIIGEVTVKAMGTTTGCGTLVPAKIPVDLQYTAPVTPPSISGPNAICPNESGVYSIALVKRATSYEWSVPSGAILNSGNGSNIINVSYGNGFTGGNITVGAKNVCGLSTPLRTRNVRLNVLPAPSAITGPTNGLCNATNANYLASAVVGATGYNWTVPATGSINSGSTSNNISVNYNPSFATGNITVAAINNCGIGASRSLAVKANPAMPGTITGPINTCAGSNQTYSIATVQGASNYIWTVPGGAVINSGQGTKVININHATVASPNGIITVKSSNACGTSALKVLSVVTSACPRLGDASIQLQVYPNPASEYINVSFNVEETQQVTISLRDAAGRVVYNEAIDAAAGFNNLQIDLSNLSKGVYFVQLQTASSSENTRLIIK
jgi:hypothetical protein